MNWLKNKKTVAVHSGSFHPDDVFSVALLSILYQGRIKVVRTRNEKEYSTADFILDVGSEYNPEKDRFDHHQVGGAGLRNNKIPYSTFGLLWKKYGEQVCSSREIADVLEKKLVQSIDAEDNALNLCQPVIDGVTPFMLTDVLYSMMPTWKEDKSTIDKIFIQAVDFSKKIILREIKVARDRVEITAIIQNFYKNTSDKRLVIIDSPKVSRFDIWDALVGFTEPLFVVYGGNQDWAVVAMRQKINNFESRKYFPKSWGGLASVSLAELTGVSDVLFCHPGLFLTADKSKEGAIKLAELALQEADNNK